MEIRSYLKQEIALRQIETALDLFFAEGDLFSVITLAGAAEEILSQFAKVAGKESLLERAVKSVFEILRITKGKDDEMALHLEDDETVHMDPYQDAIFLLGRAIDDYQVLSGVLTPKMLRFNTETRKPIR